MATQIFFVFHPYLRKTSNVADIFSRGLKAPTRKVRNYEFTKGRSMSFLEMVWGTFINDNWTIDIFQNDLGFDFKTYLLIELGEMIFLKFGEDWNPAAIVELLGAFWMFLDGQIHWLMTLKRYVFSHVSSNWAVIQTPVFVGFFLKILLPMYVRITGWWFQWFFIFTPSWENAPIWLIFFKWVETTN